MFEKILIAARGESALRIHRACHEMGIRTVAVHSTADAEAMHVRLADESVCIGPASAQESYLNMPAILTAAHITGADAIHPGIGFLSENATFAHMVQEHSLAFIGPNARSIRMMGDKIEARRIAQQAKVPILPGCDHALADLDEAKKVAQAIGYPVILKAAGGGGGRGIRLTRNVRELEKFFDLVRNEAQAHFGSSAVYIEKYLMAPKHIEVQILGDPQGNVIHMGERDCSLQRRHQKLCEEALCPALNESDRKNVTDNAVRLAKAVGYDNIGTIEFLYQDGQFYFMEMNTRLQVEHPVSEMITSIDIVREQIRISAGGRLSLKQEDVQFSGHAIECRINAEDSKTFTPSPGTISDYHPPGGLDVRVDSALYAGYRIPPWYDGLIAKLIVRGRTRNECLMRLRRSLEEFVITGIETTIPLHQKLITSADFIDGQYDIHWLEKMIAES